MHRITPAVAEDLNFDVARLTKVFLDIDLVIAEGGFCLRPGRAEGIGHLVSILGQFHATPAAARGGLDDHRIAKLFPDRHRVFQGRDAAVRARYARNAQILHGVLGGDLVAHDPDVLGRGTDERNVVIFEDLHEFGVL